jgi:flagellar biosynthetic protein FlhB
MVASIAAEVDQPRRVTAEPEALRAVAEEAGGPVVEDAPLARALYASVEVDAQIPIAQYEAVAKVIGFVLAGRRRFSAAR